MTPNEEKAIALYQQFIAEKGCSPMLFEFAAFCLDKREEEFKHEQGRLEAIINYTSNPERMVLTEFVAELTGIEVKEIVREYKKY